MAKEKRIRMLMEKAVNDLQEYVNKQEEEDEEIDPEVPIYFAELKLCKTEKEIRQYMKEFGWKSAGRPHGIKQTEKRYVVYIIDGDKKKKIGKYPTFEEMALDLDLTTDQCQNIYYNRAKKLMKIYEIKKL